MIEIITNAAPSVSESAPKAQSVPAYGNDDIVDRGYLDFQMMVDGGESHDSWGQDGSPAVGGPLTGNDAMQLLRNVDVGKANMQAALLRASMSPDQAGMQAAAVALSRYDLQTLLTSKIANKAFQAVDRLTNLQ